MHVTWSHRRTDGELETQGLSPHVAQCCWKHQPWLWAPHMDVSKQQSLSTNPCCYSPCPYFKREHGWVSLHSAGAAQPEFSLSLSPLLSTFTGLFVPSLTHMAMSGPRAFSPAGHLPLLIISIVLHLHPTVYKSLNDNVSLDLRVPSHHRTLVGDVIGNFLCQALF